jgi:sulfotransferase family protein
VASVGVANFAPTPLVIGATGGSGTRVIARIATLAGYNLGAKLNSAGDALEFYSFHDRWINPFVSAQRRREKVTPWQSVQMKEDFHAALARHIPQVERRATRWGWKAPRSIYLLPFLHAQFGQLKFIHVLRDGRDMALSRNQNQIRKHGPAVLSWAERLFGSVPERSVLMWERVNSHAADYGASILRENYLRVRFEDLCAKPLETTARILGFLESTIDPEPIARAEITPPGSLGRWQTCPPQIVSKLEAAAASSLRRFGYLE